MQMLATFNNLFGTSGMPFVQLKRAEASTYHN